MNMHFLKIGISAASFAATLCYLSLLFIFGVDPLRLVEGELALWRAAVILLAFLASAHWFSGLVISNEGDGLGNDRRNTRVFFVAPVLMGVALSAGWLGHEVFGLSFALLAIIYVGINVMIRGDASSEKSPLEAMHVPSRR